MAALDAAIERDLQKQGVEAALDELRAAMQQATEHAGLDHRKRQSAVFRNAIERLGRVVPTLGLTEVQTSYMADLIRQASEETQTYFDEIVQSESDFADVVAATAASGPGRLPAVSLSRRCGVRFAATTITRD